MSSPPDIPGKPRNQTICFRLTTEGLAAVDEMRGEMPRGEFVRLVIKQAWESGVTSATLTPPA